MNLPLEGTSVLDIGTLTPGKFCTALLADMGASVLRVERPPASRGSITDEDVVLNRGKKSLTLNLRAQPAKEILYRLTERHAVVVESYRPGVARRIGIDYETLKGRNPRIVYCSLSGFGQDGPYAGRPAYDLLFVALSGVLSAFVENGKAPFVPGVYLSDAVSGLMAALAITAALVHQKSTGTGCYLNLAMLDSVFSILSVSHGISRPPGLSAAAVPASPFYSIYETADGRYLALGAIRPESCQALCRELGRPELAARQPADAQESAALSEFLRQAFKQASAAEWLERLVPLDIEVAPVNTPAQAFADPQIIARGLVVEAPHPEAGSVRRIASPIRFSAGRAGKASPAPLVGQHSEEVLGSLGYSEVEIARLREQGVT